MNKAVLAFKSQARVGNPTEDDFIDMVNKGTLTNFPVTPVGFSNASHMFVPDISGVEIKTVQQKPDRVEVEDITITSDCHCFVSVTLTADVMFINGVTFLITLSWCI